MAYNSTNEVIDGRLVVRFNGNNWKGSRESVGTVGRKARPRRNAGFITAAQKRAAKVRAKEAQYTWRELGG